MERICISTFKTGNRACISTPCDKTQNTFWWILRVSFLYYVENRVWRFKTLFLECWQEFTVDVSEISFNTSLLIGRWSIKVKFVQLDVKRRGKNKLKDWISDRASLIIVYEQASSHVHLVFRTRNYPQTWVLILSKFNFFHARLCFSRFSRDYFLFELSVADFIWHRCEMQGIFSLFHLPFFFLCAQYLCMFKNLYF